MAYGEDDSPRYPWLISSYLGTPNEIPVRDPSALEVMNEACKVLNSEGLGPDPEYSWPVTKIKTEEKFFPYIGAVVAFKKNIPLADLVECSRNLGIKNPTLGLIQDIDENFFILRVGVPSSSKRPRELPQMMNVMISREKFDGVIQHGITLTEDEDLLRGRLIIHYPSSGMMPEKMFGEPNRYPIDGLTVGKLRESC